MAIAYYRTVIDERNLPPDAIEIVQAYISISSIFFKHQGIESALYNYRRAQHLLLQHHLSTYPFKLGLLFKISIRQDAASSLGVFAV